MKGCGGRPPSQSEIPPCEVSVGLSQRPGYCCRIEELLVAIVAVGVVIVGLFVQPVYSAC